MKSSLNIIVCDRFRGGEKREKNTSTHQINILDLKFIYTLNKKKSFSLFKFLLLLIILYTLFFFVINFNFNYNKN